MGNGLIGKILGRRYRIVGELGRGAMGDVYLAEHEGLGRRFAIKVLRPEFASDPVLAERFRREAHTTSRLNHPNIVSIADFGRLPDGEPYLVMEHIEGPSLREIVDRAFPDPLPLRRALTILAQVGSALGAAHAAGVVHRDLKPANILVSPRPDGFDEVKILDFGLAKILDEAGLQTLTMAGEIFGTPRYMAPEQAAAQAVDHRADLYALGVIAFELVTGHAPFEYPNPTRLLLAHANEEPPSPCSVRPPDAPPLPEPLCQVILSCLAKRPADRPDRIQDVLAVLAALWPSVVPSDPVAVSVMMADPATADAADGDWSEVTVEGTYTGIAPTLFDVEEQVTGPRARSESPDADTWAEVVVRAKKLADLLRTHRSDDLSLTRLKAELEHLEQRVDELEKELVFGLSRRREIEDAVRQLETQLRNAIVDLTAERCRLEDTGQASINVLADLDFQIGELERQLSALYEQQTRKLGEVARFLEAQEAAVAEARQRLLDREAELLNLLHRLRPEPCPLPLAIAYDEVRQALARLSN